MKLSTYAKQLGISYQTAWRLFKDGKLNVYQLPTGTVIVREEETRGVSGRCLLSCLLFGKKGEPGVTEAAAPGLIQVVKRINNSFTDWMVL
jgi:hypothetical protein